MPRGRKLTLRDIEMMKSPREDAYLDDYQEVYPEPVQMPSQDTGFERSRYRVQGGDGNIQRALILPSQESLYGPYQQRVDELNKMQWGMNPERYNLGVESGETTREADLRHMRRLRPQLQKRMRTMDPSNPDYRLMESYQRRMSEALAGEEARENPFSLPPGPVLDTQMELNQIEAMDEFERELLLQELENERILREMGY